MDDRKIEIALSPGIKHERILDLFNGEKTIKVNNRKITVTVPKKKARIYIYPKISKEEK